MTGKIFLLFSFLILSCHIAQASNVASLIYNSKGQLIADTNYRISKNQLHKFISVENKLTKQILDSLKTVPLFWENGLSFKVIVSFTVDEHSCFSNLHIERIMYPAVTTKHDSLLFVAPVYSNSNFMFLNPILENSCKFKKEGFKADKKKCEKYFLPILFGCNNNSREIKDGWLFYQKATPPINDKSVY